MSDRVHNRLLNQLVPRLLVVAALLFCAGCSAQRELKLTPSEFDRYAAISNVYQPEPTECYTEALPGGNHDTLTPPLDPDSPELEYRNLTVQDAIQTALMNSTVLRSLGGAIVQTPQSINSIHNPAIQESDPRTGIEGALSEFDAQLRTSAFLEKNDRGVNNRFAAGSNNVFAQDLFNYEWELFKQSASGAEFAARHTLQFDRNNSNGNRFPSSWDTVVEAEIRQPLLRGAGMTFNRIAGPNSTAGVYNGVVISRVNNDISQAEFQTALREYVSSVENAYWDLYFAYRDLQAKKQARDKALETWQRIKAQAGAEAGSAEREAQAREQYYRFQEEVDNAFTGRLLEGTRPNNGSQGGTFRATPGVLVAERRLRLIMGVPINDGQLVRPEVDPALVKVSFHWPEITQEALARRPEIQRQRLFVQRRELELVASRNHLLPQLDAVARYRWRGFGEDLLDPNRNGDGPFDNAFNSLTSGDLQEWQVGVELSYPLGFRQAHTAVHNVKLLLAREKALLHEQEREVLHDLTNAVSDMKRAYRVAMNAFNRRVAARKYVSLLEEKAQLGGQVNLFELLDAQRRATEADISYFRALVDYAIALKNIHYEKGSLWEYNQIVLSDDPWVPQTIEFAPEDDSAVASSAAEQSATEVQLDEQVAPAAFHSTAQVGEPTSMLRRLPAVE